MILTSNLADYLGFPKILDHFSPLLRNGRSYLVTEFLNWRDSHFLPRSESEVQKVLSGTEYFCDRALRFSADFPLAELPFSAMLDCFVFRELLHVVDCPATKSKFSRELQELQLEVKQEGSLYAWPEARMLKVLQDFRPLCHEIFMARWGVARKMSGNLFPFSYAAADCLWASGHERTLEWAVPKCCREGCDASVDSSKRCGGCKKVWYCSASCQRDAWPIHRFVCKGEIQTCV